MIEKNLGQLSNNDIRLSVSRDPVELANQAEAWDLLLLDSPQRSPFLSYAWVSSYLDHRPQEEESWYVIFAHEGKRLIGVLPVVVTPNIVAGFSRPVLRTPYDLHTLGGDLLISGDAPDSLLNTMIKAAERETPNRFVFKLCRVSENSPTLTSSFVRIGRNAYLEPADIGYFFPVEGEFNEYFTNLSKKFRGNLRRAENQLKKLTKIETIIKEGKDATADDLGHFMNIEASGWKGHEGSAIKCSSDLEAFYTTLTQRLSKSAMLRWEFLEGDGHTLAANLSVRFGGIVVVWKLGYDEDYSKYSPGGILFKNILESAFSQDSIKEFNLMTDTTWQTKWNPRQRSYFNLYLYPRHPLSFLFGYAPLRAKELLRRIPFLLSFVRIIKKLRHKY